MSAFEPGGDQSSIASVTDRVRPVAIGAPVTSIHFLGDRATFVGAEESVSFLDGEGEITRVAVNGGGILCAPSHGTLLVMGVDAAKPVPLYPNSQPPLPPTSPPRPPISHSPPPS